MGAAATGSARRIAGMPGPSGRSRAIHIPSARPSSAQETASLKILTQSHRAAEGIRTVIPGDPGPEPGAGMGPRWRDTTTIRDVARPGSTNTLLLSPRAAKRRRAGDDKFWLLRARCALRGKLIFSVAPWLRGSMALREPIRDHRNQPAKSGGGTPQSAANSTSVADC